MDNLVPHFSGALGHAPLFVPAALLATVPVLSLAYAYVDVYSPIAGWISFAFVAGFGLALGWIVGKAGYLARCRNPRFLQVMGALAGLLGLYFSWAWFELALTRRSEEPIDLGITDVLTRPGLVWEVATTFARSGWYTLGALRPSGSLLWSSWIAEGLLVVGLATWQAGFGLDEQVFCERCGRWCEADGEPTRLAVPAGRARPRVRSGDVGAIVELATETPEESDHVLLDLRRCSRCQETGAFRLQRVAIRSDDEGKSKHFLERAFDLVHRKGKSKQHVETILDYVLREPAEIERLRALRRG